MGDTGGSPPPGDKKSGGGEEMEVTYADRLLKVNRDIDITRSHLKEVRRQKTAELRAEKKKYTSVISALKQKAKENGISSLTDEEVRSFVSAVIASEEVEREIDRVTAAEQRVGKFVGQLASKWAELTDEYLTRKGLKPEPLRVEVPARITAASVEAALFRLVQAVGEQGGSGA
jgi:hypothetical protein